MLPQRHDPYGRDLHGDGAKLAMGRGCGQMRPRVLLSGWLRPPTSLMKAWYWPSTCQTRIGVHHGAMNGRTIECGVGRQHGGRGPHAGGIVEKASSPSPASGCTNLVPTHAGIPLARTGEGPLLLPSLPPPPPLTALFVRPVPCCRSPIPPTGMQTAPAKTVSPFPTSSPTHPP